MIDKSNEILSLLKKPLLAKYHKLTITTVQLSDQKADFPALYVKFSFPSELPGTHDSSGVEKWTRTKCVAEAYSRTSMQEAKGIIALMDTEMSKLGFSRSNWTEVPNADASIRRIQATWRGAVNRSGDVAAW